MRKLKWTTRWNTMEGKNKIKNIDKNVKSKETYHNKVADVQYDEKNRKGKIK